MGATIRSYRSVEFGNTFLRIFSEKGSFPVQLTNDDGSPVSDEEIGRQMREGSEYFLTEQTLGGSNRFDSGYKL